MASARYRGTSWALDLILGGTQVVAVAPPTLKAAPGDLVRVTLPTGHGHVVAGNPKGQQRGSAAGAT